MNAIRACTLPALTLALLTSATSESDSPAQDNPAEEVNIPAKIQKDIGEKAIDILTGATQVEVFQLEPKPRRKVMPATVGSSNRQWTLAATGKEPGKAFAARVRAALLDGTTCTIGWEPEFERADVAFRFRKDKASIAVVDFKSGCFSVVTRTADGKLLKTAGGDDVAAKRD